MLRFLFLMRCLSFLFVGMILFSCTNKKAAEVQNSRNKDIDSLSLAQRQDSIEREYKIDALGDTVFNCICYGMSISQFKKAYELFKKPRRSKEHKDHFVFADYEFYILDSYKDITKSEIRNPIKDTDLWTDFYKNQLFSVKWNGWRKIESPQSTEESLTGLVSYFEKKYGPANLKNGWIDNGRVVAEWETENRKIMILYRDLIGVSRDKYVDEVYPSYKQYEVDVLFIDKTIKKEVDDFVDKKLEIMSIEYIQKMKQDSINNAHAL